MIDNDRSDAAPSPPPPAGPSTVEPETIFVAQNRVRGLAIAGDRAYFSEADEYVDRFGSDSACIDGKVGSIGRDGAGPPVWVTPRPKCPGSIVVVGDHVVFREPGWVVAQPLSRKGPARRKGDDQSYSDYALAADGERVFFPDTRSDRLIQWSPSTNATRTMGRADAQDDLAVAGRFVVISGSSRVRLLPVDGSAERILAESKRDNFRRAAVHGSQVFVVREVDGRLGPEPVVRKIIRVAISGPQPPEVIHRTRGPVHHLAVDDRRLFFIAADPSGSRERVESVDLDRKEHRLLWSRIGPIDNLVLHEAHVYFSADDRILRIGKRRRGTGTASTSDDRQRRRSGGSAA